MPDKILFSETQRFKQIWIWIILIPINGLFIFGFIKQVILHQPFGDKPASDAVLIVAALFMAALTYLFIIMRLETKITSEGIDVRFYPLQWTYRHYTWDNMVRSFVRRYSPIGEYGGWGLRGIGKKRALNISGNMGIQLVMQDGLNLLIGTKKPDEVTEVLKKINKWKSE